MKNVSKEMGLVLNEGTASKMKRKCLNLLVVAAMAALLVPSLALAVPLMGSELSSFAALGATTVTNIGATTLTGNLGVNSGAAITGQETVTLNGTTHVADPFALAAQNQLAISRTNLGLLGPGTTLANADLAGLTLTPGVYTVSAGISNLTGTLTLDGQGDANAFWAFQMADTLITSSGSKVNVINAGTGSGVFWNVASSATLGTTTAFEGNILALASITLDTGATIGCGRALASTGAVTMAGNTISSACTELLTGTTTGIGSGSNGFSGSGLSFDATTNTVVASGAVGAPVVPEPSTMILFGSGLAGLVVFRKKFKKA